MSIGGVRCPTCQGELTTMQALARIISRLNECDEMDSNLISGLVACGMTECDRCGGWFKETEAVRAGDRCSCPHCFDWTHFVREDDDEEMLEHVLPDLMRRIAGTDFMKHLPHERTGKNKGRLAEPFLTYYNRLTTRV